MFEKLIIHHHLGLGDHIICAGLVDYLVRKLNLAELHLVVKRQNVSAVASLYRHSAAIKFIPILGKSEEAEVLSLWPQLSMPLLKITCTSKLNFDEEFYAQVNVPFFERYGFFERNFASRLSKLSGIRYKNAEENIHLIAGGSSVGYTDLPEIPGMANIKVTPLTQSILDWIPIIMQANAISVVQSSFMLLADSFDLSGKELRYYDTGRGGLHHLRNNWIEVAWRI